MTNAAIKNAICEATIEPGDGSAAIPLEYVLIRGFSAMGWKLPATAAGDMIDTIAERIVQQLKLKETI
jgi:hypothetical protein